MWVFTLQAKRGVGGVAVARSKVLSSGQIAKHRGQARRIRTPTTRVIELGLQQPPRRRGGEKRKKTVVQEGISRKENLKKNLSKIQKSRVKKWEIGREHVPPNSSSSCARDEGEEVH